MQSKIKVPELLLPNLMTLSLANNLLPSVPPEIASNISSLRELNLDFNDLSTVPIVTHSLKELRKLSLAQNPIMTMSNTTLLGIAEHLSDLDIANFDLEVFEIGALSNMNSLRNLRISTYDDLQNLNFPRVLENNVALRSLEVHVEKKATPLSFEMMGDFPPKLSSVTFSGRGLKKVDKYVLKVAIRHFRLICLYF